MNTDDKAFEEFYHDLQARVEFGPYDEDLEEAFKRLQALGTCDRDYVATNYLWARWLNKKDNTIDALWHLNTALAKSTDDAMTARILFGITLLRWKRGNNELALRAAHESMGMLHRAMRRTRKSGLEAFHELLRQTAEEIDWDVNHPKPWFWERWSRYNRRQMLELRTADW